MRSSYPEVFDFDQLTILDVSFHYGRRRALDRVSLTLHMGELVGLLGPNGSGKSTLLGLLATLIEPSKGSVRYGHKSASEAGTVLRSQIGFLSHDLQLYPELTAQENLDFFAKLYGLPDSARCIALALESAGLKERAADLVQSLSRGMRQRLALERALLHGPRLILLDEPFTGLDEYSSSALASRLKTLKRDGRIVLLATHDLDALDGLIDRAIILREGKMDELKDNVGSLKQRYRQEFRQGDR